MMRHPASAPRYPVVHGPMAIPIAMVATTVVSAAMQAQAQKQQGAAAAVAGQEQQQGEQYQAEQLQQNAGQEIAQSQRQAANIRRNTDLTLSTVKANAAASGAGAADPTVINQVDAPVAARGNFDALSALYTGESRANAMENQSAADLYQGNLYAQAGGVKKQAGNTQALSTLVGTGGSLFAKYGGGLFATNGAE